jgi:uncharacterized membrane protein
MELLTIFTAFGLSFSAGLNAYIPLFIIGALAHYTNLITLTKPWDTLANPWALIIIGVLIIIEFLADKLPAINHFNDAFQTIVRPVAGAIAFAATAGIITNLHPVVALVCGLLIAGGVHTVKSAMIRPAVTATTGGTANIPVSMAEDVIASGISLVSIILPVIIALISIFLIVILAWWLWRRNYKTA